MQITDGIALLELTTGWGSSIYPTLLWEDHKAILIDTGYPGQLHNICQEMAYVGVQFSNLSKVILTHQDVDHTGGLPDLLRSVAHNIQVLAYEVEKPYIEGCKPLIKAHNSDRVYVFDSLPEQQRVITENLIKNPPIITVDRALVDGDFLPDCGGITVIAMPGHTPGHIMVYLNRHKILIPGDGLICCAGCLLGPKPQFTEDMDLAMQSLVKLNQYDIEMVLCYHGGIFCDQPNKRISELVRNYFTA